MGGKVNLLIFSFNALFSFCNVWTATVSALLLPVVVVLVFGFVTACCGGCCFGFSGCVTGLVVVIFCSRSCEFVAGAVFVVDADSKKLHIMFDYYYSFLDCYRMQ